MPTISSTEAASPGDELFRLRPLSLMSKNPVALTAKAMNDSKAMTAESAAIALSLIIRGREKEREEGQPPHISHLPAKSRGQGALGVLLCKWGGRGVVQKGRQSKGCRARRGVVHLANIILPQPKQVRIRQPAQRGKEEGEADRANSS